MSWEVFLTPESQVDVLVLHQYVRLQTGQERADAVVTSIESLCESLAELPERGHLVPELATLGYRTMRELHWHSWRIIYEVGVDIVVVHAVIDGRRNLGEVLSQRMALVGGG